jgi:outer membrane receptor protein involved in Fe transport
VGSLFITHQLGNGWHASLLSYHQSRTKWRGGGIGSSPIDSWFRHDLSLSKRWALDDKAVKVEFKAENLSDESYVEYQAGNITKGNLAGNYFNRRFFISASLDW